MQQKLWELLSPRLSPYNVFNKEVHVLVPLQAQCFSNSWAGCSFTGCAHQNHWGTYPVPFHPPLPTLSPNSHSCTGSLSPAQTSVWPKGESDGGNDPDQIRSVILGYSWADPSGCCTASPDCPSSKAHSPSSSAGPPHHWAKRPKLAGKYSSCYFSGYFAARWTPWMGTPQDQQSFLCQCKGAVGWEAGRKQDLSPWRQQTKNCTLHPATPSSTLPWSIFLLTWLWTILLLTYATRRQRKDGCRAGVRRWWVREGLPLPGSLWPTPADVLGKRWARMSLCSTTEYF